MSKNELVACLDSVNQMIERVKRLEVEYNLKVRSRPFEDRADVGSLDNAIEFAELRSLDLLCLDVLKRTAPQFVKDWYVNDYKELASPEEVLRQFKEKRIILLHVINLFERDDVGSADAQEQTEDILSGAYARLTEFVDRFFRNTSADCQDYDRNVFIMTRFQKGNRELEEIDQAIRETLRARNLVGHRADDADYTLPHNNLWDNVCTYMHCCKYGIAVLENYVEEEFNPNVALEYGFMKALGKPVLLLKEKRFQMRADILGNIWQEFEIVNISETVPTAINTWVDHLSLR